MIDVTMDDVAAKWTCFRMLPSRKPAAASQCWAGIESLGAVSLFYGSLQWTASAQAVTSSKAVSALFAKLLTLACRCAFVA